MYQICCVSNTNNTIEDYINVYSLRLYLKNVRNVDFIQTVYTGSIDLEKVKDNSIFFSISTTNKKIPLSFRKRYLGSVMLCRDLFTTRLFRKSGFLAFFCISPILRLTKPYNPIRTKEFKPSSVLIINLPKFNPPWFKRIKGHKRHFEIRGQRDLKSNQLSELFEEIASSLAVITSSLEVLLVSQAFKIPVILVLKNRLTPEFSGYISNIPITDGYTYPKRFDEYYNTKLERAYSPSSGCTCGE